MNSSSRWLGGSCCRTSDHRRIMLLISGYSRCAAEISFVSVGVCTALCTGIVAWAGAVGVSLLEGTIRPRSGFTGDGSPGSDWQESASGSSLSLPRQCSILKLSSLRNLCQRFRLTRESFICRCHVDTSLSQPRPRGFRSERGSVISHFDRNLFGETGAIC